MDNDILVVANGLVFRDDSGQPVTTSLEIAERFEKEHKNVLRAIESLECSEEFNRLNFEPVDYLDAKGEARRCYRITRDGFMFLAMGFTGAKAARWKEAFIIAFNALESTALDLLRRVTDVVAVAQAATQVKVDVVCDEVRGVGDKVERLDEKVTSFAAVANQHRRRITESTRAEHRLVLARQNWSCPVCRRVREPSSFEFDHMFTNQQADFEHTWPLCTPCHADLSAGRLSRGDVRSDFDAYQEFAKRGGQVQRPLF